MAKVTITVEDCEDGTVNVSAQFGPLADIDSNNPTPAQEAAAEILTLAGFEG